MTYSIGTPTYTNSSLGTITSEDRIKDSQLFQFPTPASDSSNTVLIDIFGVNASIRIKGAFVETDTAPTTRADGGATVGATNVAKFIDWLEHLINGTQSVARTYVSDTSLISYSTLILNCSWSRRGGEPNKIDYEISMVEGALQ